MEKPKVNLGRTTGSMFGIIRECITAAKDSGWQEKDLIIWCERAVSGGHENLMKCVEEKFDVVA